MKQWGLALDQGKSIYEKVMFTTYDGLAREPNIIQIGTENIVSRS